MARDEAVAQDTSDVRAREAAGRGTAAELGLWADLGGGLDAGTAGVEREIVVIAPAAAERPAQDGH